ncbi:uncharacterized protein LOC118464646 [Anopheles albimanus]|uniref:uncharacterized protein LOC118464646 n=1 Tax=Anopheles albimanus TaxID=7167 RepID=UPI001640DBAA|nr:uncharacterized protein LOC118464646 [Anopheles albimanus]
MLLGCATIDNKSSSCPIPIALGSCGSLLSKMKKTVPKQFEKLVELMKANQNFAKGFHGFGESKSNVKVKWEEFAEELNALGPPMRTGSEWQRVWLDMKMKVKKIVAENKRQLQATGGGPYSVKTLTPLQQDIDQLLNISGSVYVTGQSFGIGPDDDQTDIPHPIVKGEVSSQVRPLLPLIGGDDSRNYFIATEEPTEQATEEPTISAKAVPEPSEPNRRKRRRLVTLEKERNDALQKSVKLQEGTVEQLKVVGDNINKLAEAIMLQTQAIQQQTEATNKLFSFLANKYS